ncbi:carbohydrate kinase [bacterium]|nr:carbohydrate kinase [bacterium]
MPSPFQVAVIGEVLWDVFPDQQRLGGAPANFAGHVHALAGEAVDVTLVSAIGDDPLGEETLQRLQQNSLRTSAIGSSSHPTGKVIVTLQDGSPEYEIAHPAAWDAIEWTPAAAAAAENADAVCFGTLAQRSSVSRETIQKFIAATGPSCLRMLDINIRPTMEDPTVYRQSLELANMLKLSDEELSTLADQFELVGDETNQLKQLATRFDLQLIAYTRGGDGATLIRGDEVNHCQGVPTTVVDTVGAGDSFTATLVWELLQQHDLATANQNACRVAAFVCSQNGATPEIPASIYPGG